MIAAMVPLLAMVDGAGTALAQAAQTAQPGTPAQTVPQPALTPVPDWVRPFTWRTTQVGDANAPVQVLASDVQVKLVAGESRRFAHTVLRIGSPEGLAAGNLSLVWSPDLQTLAVHSVLIHRGNDVIDVLKSGQTFTVVRREQNLESAMLDGMLTANLQPEGLQVGDVLEFSFTITSHDPVLQGHVEDMEANWNGLPIGSVHYRASWPVAMPVHWRTAGALPAIKPQRQGGEMVAELAIDDLKPVIPPRLSPARYHMGRTIELTDYAAWGDIARIMAPLYAKAAQLPATGPLHDELEKIRALPGPDMVRVTAALKLVQDRVRYVALEMGTGGYVPTDAATTWARRFGDCKAKTALLLGLLQALNIPAVPVVVHTAAGDGLDQRLPLLRMFNHVLVRASIAGETYWLDGTRTGRHLLKVEHVPDFHWGLPLVDDHSTLVKMVPPPLTTPDERMAVHVDATAGVNAPAPVTADLELDDDKGAGTNSSLVTMSAEARAEALRRFWKDRLGQVDVATTDFHYDDTREVLHVTMTGTLHMTWANGEYRLDRVDFPLSKIDYSRTAGPDADAPFAVTYPVFRVTTETMTLPKASGAFRIGTDMDVHAVIAGFDFLRSATIRDNVFTITKSEVSLQSEFPAAQAKAAEAQMHALALKTPLLHMPLAYQSTTADVAAAKADTPTTAADYVNRAVIYLKKNLTTEALADLNRALELDPNNAYARSDLAMLKLRLHDLAGARADLARAEAISPNLSMNFRVRGELAMNDNNLAAAVAAFEQALSLDHDDGFTLSRLATGEYRLGHYAKSLDYFDRLAKLSPETPATRYLRISLLEKLGRDDDLVTLLNTMIAAAPNSVYLLRKRAEAYRRLGKADLAAKDTVAADEAAKKAPVVVVPPPPKAPTVAIPAKPN